MTGAYATSIIVVSVVLGVWALVLVAMNRLPGKAILAGAAVLEALLVGFLVGGIVQMGDAGADLPKAEFVGYLISCVVVLPLAVAWGLTERTRSGTAVLAVGFLLIPILILRVQQVWAGPLV